MLIATQLIREEDYALRGTIELTIWPDWHSRWRFDVPRGLQSSSLIDRVPDCTLILLTH